MVNETILVPIITGGCVILSACMERIMNIICPEIRKKIVNLCFKDKNRENTPPPSPPPPPPSPSPRPYTINSPATCVLKILWENPNIGKNKFKYVSTINNGEYYNIEIPPNLKNINVNVYQEYLYKSETNEYCLAVKLNNVNTDNVKIFIKRFREKNFLNREWVPTSFKPFEYIKGKNGNNLFTAKSYIGTNDVLFEQLGVMVESNTETYSKCIIERVYLENKPMCIND